MLKIKLQKYLKTRLQVNTHHEKHIINDRLCYFKPKAEHKEKGFAEELSYSLQQTPKFIPPKFFYNQKGSKLFEKICDLPEYYLTRTEIEILSHVKCELPDFVKGRFRLVELGSGASVKTRHLLDVLQKSQHRTEYIPIDISEFLEQSAYGLLDDYTDLSIVGVIDTYENGLRFVKNYDDCSNLIVFFGSSFGNFSLGESKEFLKNVHESMKDQDLFLMGLDLIKDKLVLENAYDDSQGITAQFNLNVLERINEELGANFDLDAFSHYSTYNEKEQRIEMYLRSLKNQGVFIAKADLSLSFKENELVHTENSYKFSLAKINSLIKQSGFNMLKIWQDADRKFIVALLAKNSVFDTPES